MAISSQFQTRILEDTAKGHDIINVYKFNNQMNYVQDDLWTLKCCHNSTSIDFLW